MSTDNFTPNSEWADPDAILQPADQPAEQPWQHSLFESQQAEARRNAALQYAAAVGNTSIEGLIADAQVVYNYLLNGPKPLDEG